MRNNIIFLIINLIGFGFVADLVVRIFNGHIGFGFQWLGIVIIILYSLWMRYYLREKLLNKMSFSKNVGISRPYALVAVFFLFIAMLFNLAGNERVANGFAIVAYYFLIEVVIVEIINLKKKGSTEKKENA